MTQAHDDRMLILTGRIGYGKTTFLQRVILGNDVPVQGFLSLKIVEDGVIRGIKLLTLPWRNEMFLADASAENTGLSTGAYVFKPEVFKGIEELFADPDCGLPFIFDEFGVLEMRGKAHYPLFQKLVETRVRMLVVVRSDLIEDFTSRFTHGRAPEVVDLENDMHAGEKVLRYLGGGLRA